MRVVFKAPGRDAEVRDLDVNEDNMLEVLQKTVGGDRNAYVEQVGVGPGVNILIDEDGLAKNLPDNCGFVGNLVFLGERLISEDEGYEWDSLTAEDERKVLAWCKKHASDVHPDRAGTGFRMITGDKAIAEFRERQQLEARSKLMEWQSL